MVLRTTRALLPGDRIATSRADHEGVVLRPLKVTALPLHGLVTREVAVVRPTGPTGRLGRVLLGRYVVEFTDGTTSQPVTGQAGWDLQATPTEHVVDLRGTDLRATDTAGLTARRGTAARSPRRRRPAARGSAARVDGRAPGLLSQ